MKEQWSAFFDCSKIDEGIERYRELGCDVVVIHTVRAYSTWVRSMMKYRARYKLGQPGRIRLLIGYLRINRRLACYAQNYPYHAIRQEQLSQLKAHMPPDFTKSDFAGEYKRHEMFGAPNYSSSYSRQRAASKVTPLDRALYFMIGIR